MLLYEERVHYLHTYVPFNFHYYELEKHILSSQNKGKEYECDKCEAAFLSNWSFTHHMSVHQNLQLRKFHYFNNGLTCPF